MFGSGLEKKKVGLAFLVDMSAFDDFIIIGSGFSVVFLFRSRFIEVRAGVHYRGGV